MMWIISKTWINPQHNVSSFRYISKSLKMVNIRALSSATTPLVLTRSVHR